jgi:hypothetical protein
MGKGAVSCPACTEAMQNRYCGAYRADCLECAARSLSQSPAHHAAAQANAMTPRYRDALQSRFGADWMAMHARVKWWAQHR